MHLKSDCGKCHGTGLIPAGAEHDYFAHAYLTSCSCEEGRNWAATGESIWGKPQERWGGNRHKLVLAESCSAIGWIDELIAEEVKLLWSNGIATNSSCQADNGRAFISLDHPHQAEQAEFLTGWSLDTSFENVLLVSRARK